MTDRDYRVGQRWRTVGPDVTPGWRDCLVVILERKLGELSIQRIDAHGISIGNDSIISDATADDILVPVTPFELPKFQSVEEANQWLSNLERE